MSDNKIFPTPKNANTEAVDHPEHYGGASNPYETIKIWKALGWLEPACLSNAIKYVMRAGKKDKDKKIEDLKKARWYLDYLIEDLETK